MAIQAQLSSGFVFGGCQDLLTENACGLNNFCLMPRNPKIVDDHPSVSQIISAQIENQRIEIDHYINSQNERLRIALQEQRKQQMVVFLMRYESKIQPLIKQKDEEILKAAQRNVELQDWLTKMEMEREAWERLAQEKEAMVGSLSATIQRLRESAAASGAAEDAESCCSGERERETWERVCRCCNSRKSCVIMLPCRHLCSCRDCDAFLDFCPLCNVPKKASLEALS